jgi:hypothetical protein
VLSIISYKKINVQVDALAEGRFSFSAQAAFAQS